MRRARARLLQNGFYKPKGLTRGARIHTRPPAVEFYCRRCEINARSSTEARSSYSGKTPYQPTYKPTNKPSLRGSDGCADDADWLYDAGDKGLKGCDFIASEPAKVEKRCSRRVGEDGVPALEACKQTCGKC